MFKLLRRPPPYQTPLAMIGAKSGDRVLVTGGHDHGLAAAVAVTTGLNGQTVVVAPAEARSAVEAAAAEAGSLVDAAIEIPHDAVFDIGVWQVEASSMAGPEAQARAAALMDSLRPGGRAILMAREKAGGLFSKREPTEDRAIIDLLTQVGARAVRMLGAAESVAYYEARKG